MCVCVHACKSRFFPRDRHGNRDPETNPRNRIEIMEQLHTKCDWHELHALNATFCLSVFFFFLCVCVYDRVVFLFFFLGQTEWLYLFFSYFFLKE